MRPFARRSRSPAGWISLSGSEQPSTHRLGAGCRRGARLSGRAAVRPFRRLSLTPMSEAVGAESRLLLNPRRRMERVSPEGKCDEACQQQKAAADRDQEMRERHLGTSQLRSFMRREMHRNLAIKCTSKIDLPRRPPPDSPKGGWHCALPTLRFQGGRQATRLLPPIVRFVTPLNCHEDNR